MSDATVVVLVQPPVWGVYDPPVALAQISACLKQRGFRVHVCDLNIELYHERPPEYEHAWAIEQSSFWTDERNVRAYFASQSAAIDQRLGAIAALKPALVGFSVNVCSLHATKLLSRLLKDRLPAAMMAAGGPMFCVPFDGRVLLNGESGIDVIVQGEGENAFVELAGIAGEGRPKAACAGIVYKDGEEIRQTGPREPVEDMDALPFLDLASFPLDKYTPPGHLGRHISLMTSRGCIQNCVFCGPRAYWQGYRSMSGKRIYDEICHHIRNYPETETIEFLDLLLNGTMRTLTGFCDLMIERPPRPNLSWRANLCVRPEMTAEVFRKMKAAGCRHVTYGIESGSQRVLGLMRKKYRIADADTCVRAAHEAGIEVTCNFMFGFPGETEEDLRCTLDFLTRNRDVLDTAYPSRTFCTIEPHSYMEKHLSEFGIVPNRDHGQYWRSEDGSNTYPVRMARCEAFSRHAQSLGINIGSGLQTSIELDKWLNLGDYYASQGERDRAVESYDNYLALDPHNTIVRHKRDGLLNMRAGER